MIHIDYDNIYSDLYDDNDNAEDIKIKNNSKRRELLNDIRDMEENSEDNFFPSDVLDNRKKSSNKEDNKIDSDVENWLNEITVFSKKPKRRSKKTVEDLFSYLEPEKKKKKKKHKDKGSVNYKKEFEPEMSLYKNLLVEQNKFTANLQKTYDNIISKRASSAGVNKQITDLIDNITSARTLSMQLIEKNVNAKKLIAELNLKQAKDAGLDMGDNLADFSSSYMKQLVSNRQSFFNDSPGDVSDYDEEGMFNEIDLNLGDERLSDESEKYIKYENRNITTYVVIYGKDTENYSFLTKAEDGEILYDYPEPFHSHITVNESTNIAVDAYGEKYPIIWEN